MNRIVFVINSISDPHCIKRINEFVSNGFEVSVFAFSRCLNVRNIPNFKYDILGEYDNDLPYHKRLSILYGGIKRILGIHKCDNVLFYLFGLDVAFIFKLLSTNDYIYEEADMQQFYIKNIFIRSLFDKVDKYIIRNSKLTIFTSEGFAKHHYGDKWPNNIRFIMNKLDRDVLKYPICEKRSVCLCNLKIGFVGGVRYDSILCFADVFCRKYIKCEFHVFGIVASKMQQELDRLSKYSNFYYHGPFRTPGDLPKIYSSIDLILSTYDLSSINVKYAEPNKLYEAIYFETPIIVTKGTYLSDKVSRLNIGYSLDPLDSYSIEQFIDSLSIDDINDKVNKMSSIPKEDVIDDNQCLFKYIEAI